MTRMLRSLARLALLVWALVRLTRAYIDPNTGGMLFQLLAGFFAVFTAILLFFSRQLRMTFARFARFVRGLFSH